MASSSRPSHRAVCCIVAYLAGERLPGTSARPTGCLDLRVCPCKERAPFVRPLTSENRLSTCSAA